MNKTIRISGVFVVAALALFLNSCAKKAEQAQTQDTTTHAAPPPQEVKLVPAGDSVQYPKAKLQIISPREGQVLQNANDSVFVIMNVTGFDIAKATPGDSTSGVAYSKQGQHVHVIVDEKPYMADYKNGQPFNVGVLAPGRHVIRAFPSRSWHESVKDPSAFAVRVFYVGQGPAKGKNAPKDSMLAALKGPMLTYSRPKGSYTTQEGQKVLLDFYLANTTLAPNGNQVRVWIDGKETTPITNWQANYITGLQPGKHTVKLQLSDAKGNLIPGPFNAPTGEFTIGS